MCESTPPSGSAKRVGVFKRDSERSIKRAKGRGKKVIRERERESSRAAVIRARRPVICGLARLLIVTKTPPRLYISAWCVRAASAAAAAAAAAEPPFIFEPRYLSRQFYFVFLPFPLRKKSTQKKKEKKNEGKR